MNRDVLEGNWKQIKGRIKETWGKLTDDDLDQIDGKTDRLLGVLQERYGYARDKAEQELNRFVNAESATWRAEKTRT
jgi:uncharacterized protein YjbJ (UPF0337 family)